jgi:hypothetical protein
MRSRPDREVPSRQLPGGSPPGSEKGDYGCLRELMRPDVGRPGCHHLQGVRGPQRRSRRDHLVEHDTVESRTKGVPAMWLTERTIDAWTAVFIKRHFPDALIWCPTTNEQHFDRARDLLDQVRKGESQPWDFIVSGGGIGKLFVLENKGLYYREKQPDMVKIDLAQYEGMLRLSRIGTAPWVFYGIPVPPLAGHVHGGSLPTASLLQPSFGSWQQMLTPRQLGDVMACASRGAVLGRTTGSTSFEPGEVAKAAVVTKARYWNFKELIKELRKCPAGLRLETLDDLHVAMQEGEATKSTNAMWVVVRVK